MAEFVPNKDHSDFINQSNWFKWRCGLSRIIAKGVTYRRPIPKEPKGKKACRAAKRAKVRELKLAEA